MKEVAGNYLLTDCLTVSLPDWDIGEKKPPDSTNDVNVGPLRTSETRITAWGLCFRDVCRKQIMEAW